MGSREKYASVSCIHPMFHLNVNPSPPSFTGVVTPDHAVDSSAIVTQPGASACTVTVNLVKPIESVGDEEVPHFLAAVVEDQRAPIGMLGETRVFVLEQRRAVEATQRVVVFGKVRRHPIEDDADARLVQRVDEESEVVGRSV